MLGMQRACGRAAVVCWLEVRPRDGGVRAGCCNVRGCWAAAGLQAQPCRLGFDCKGCGATGRRSWVAAARRAGAWAARMYARAAPAGSPEARRMPSGALPVAWGRQREASRRGCGRYPGHLDDRGRTKPMVQGSSLALRRARMRVSPPGPGVATFGLAAARGARSIGRVAPERRALWPGRAHLRLAACFAVDPKPAAGRVSPAGRLFSIALPWAEQWVRADESG